MKRLIIRPFIVFNEECEDTIRSRKGVINTSKLIEKILFDSGYLHYDRNRAVIINNSRRTDIFKRLRAFAEGIDLETEMLLFYFCGHGCPDYTSNKLYLAMKGTDFGCASDSGIAAETVNEIVTQYHIRYCAIMLDCCHAGVYSLGNPNKAVYSISISDYSDSKGAFFIPTIDTSSSFSTMEIEGKQYSPFSYYLFRTLQEGVENQFKRVSFKELYDNMKIHFKKKHVGLPPSDQKGELFNVAVWEDLKYRSVGNRYIPEETESTPNVLLIRSAIRHPIRFNDFDIPLGLWVLKDHIEKYSMDIRIEIYDERFELQKTGENNYAKEQVLKKYGEMIKEYDVVGVNMSSSEVCPGIRKLKITKKEGKVTTAGGIFTSSSEKYLLETGVVDYVIPGMGTSALRKLSERLLKQKRIKQGKESARKEYQIEKNDELSGVATMDNPWGFFVSTDVKLSNMSPGTWSIIIDRYKPFLYDDDLKVYKMDIFLTRGCKGTCTFCSVQKECGRQISHRSEASVIVEVKNLYKKGFICFSLKDEDCLNDESHFLKIVRNVQFPDIRFRVHTGVDHLLDKRDLLQELNDLGVIEIQYGIESFDYMLLNGVSKGIRKKQVDKIKEFIMANTDFNIIANCSFILSLSGETEEYYDELFSFVKGIYDYSDKCKPKIYINFLTPHPLSSSFKVTRSYKVITTDLNYFTHKFPIGFYEQEDGIGYTIREKMIDTYEKIVRYTNSTKFNPSLREEIRYEHSEAFSVGNKYILDDPQLPSYCEGE